MPKLIVPIGPAGAGKSRHHERHYPDAVKIGGDPIKHEIFPRYDVDPDFDHDAHFGLSLSELKDRFGDEIEEHLVNILGQDVVNDMKPQGVFTRGKNKGKPKPPRYKTLQMAIMKSGVIGRKIREALQDGKDVFVDAMNASPAARDDLRQIAANVPETELKPLLFIPGPEEDYEKFVQYLHQRDLMRDRHTPSDIIGIFADTPYQIARQYYQHQSGEPLPDWERADYLQDLRESGDLDNIEVVPIEDLDKDPGEEYWNWLSGWHARQRSKPHVASTGWLGYMLSKYGENRI